MPFNSVEYLLFFLAVLAASWLLVGMPRIRIAFLLLASWYFYFSNNGWVLSLLLASIAIDYVVGIAIENNAERPTRRKWLLTLSLMANLGMLGFFKYANFFIDVTASFMTPIFGEGAHPVIEVLLPVGISFYTFQSMSYSIDVYMGTLKAERSFTRFAFFVSFFPQLIAGPIVRARYFLHQLSDQTRLTVWGFEGALYLIATGLFKKVVLGDTLGDYADAAFDAPQDAHALVAWLGLYAFTFQIYFDFSGYSDIAIGCARLLGYRPSPLVCWRSP